LKVGLYEGSIAINTGRGAWISSKI
jgi:hypothetical protein